MKTQILKMAASTAFVVFAWRMGALQSVYGRTIFLALCLSWVGDLLLGWRTSLPFFAGLMMFLFAQVVFAAAFLQRGQEASWAVLGAGILILASLVVGRRLLPRLRRTNRFMLAPIVAYMIAISVMATLACGATAASRDVRLVAGALLFVVSDLFVARDRFIAAGPLNQLLGLPLYYTAQFLFAWTVAGR